VRMEIPAGGAIGRGNLPPATLGLANQQPNAKVAEVSQNTQKPF